MKKEYLTPAWDLISIQNADVITLSDLGAGPDDPYENDVFGRL